MNKESTSDVSTVTADEDETYSHGRCFPTARENMLRNVLSAGEMRYFRALMLHYRATGNTYIALEALVAMVEKQTSPPVWVLEAIAKSFSQRPENPYAKELKRISNLGVKEYKKYRIRSSRSFAMIDFAKLIGPDFDLSQEFAAELVILKHECGGEPGSLVNRYGDEKWPQFYEDLGVLPLDPMSETERREFVRSFPEVAHGHLQKIPTKT